VPDWSRPRLIAGLDSQIPWMHFGDHFPVRAEGAQVLVPCVIKDIASGRHHANQVNAIARNFPELDVIIGAHHAPQLPGIQSRNVLYCQPTTMDYLGRVDWCLTRTRTGRPKDSSNTLLMASMFRWMARFKLAGAEIDRAEKVSSTRLGEATDASGSGPCRARKRRFTTSSSVGCRPRVRTRRQSGRHLPGIIERRDGLRKRDHHQRCVEGRAVRKYAGDLSVE